ncbi:MOSC domain-containing protein [Pseudonocardia spinosispora]|uniref:MOSC domain-containing protein n=1 Tax=Pseudonocardia spinosispora TaxID=103441 RepID=UPI00048CAEC5|nr:MOSC N-terminal beta barrel domain-containing protein [Pseudonocardia spinosispora]
MVRIAELHCYPIKGCAGTALADSRLTPAGLDQDRAFMVVDPEGIGRTQRRMPALARIRPSVEPGRLVLNAPDVEPLAFDVREDGPRIDVEMLGKPMRGIDQGEDAARWLSDFLGAPNRLVRVPPDHDRVTDGETPGTAGYADGAAVLVTSLASLKELNGRLGERGAVELPMNRFRPNIVVDGWDEPFLEDRARVVRAGDVELGFTKLAIRCVVTTVDQLTGVKSGPEPLRTLAAYRMIGKSGVAFGVKFAVTRTGSVSIGDELAIEKWDETVEQGS